MTLDQNLQELLEPKDPLFSWRKKFWSRFQEMELPKLTFPRFGKEKSTWPLFPLGVVSLPLEEAMGSYGLFLQHRLGLSLKEEYDPMAALNGAFQQGGLFLYVPPGVQLREPIEVPLCTLSPRLHLYLGKGARLQLHLRAENVPFCNAHIDLLLDSGAELSLTHLAPAREVLFFQSLRATLKRDSLLHWLSYSEGAAIERTSLKVQLAEENSEALLQGLSRLDGERQNQIHALVEHQAPHTRSRQHFKSVLKGKSRSSFEGKILVRKSAQKTEAYQKNSALLLSEEATVTAKPNLEIFADDVKASHGATVAQLNQEELFYLRSRGLSLSEAESWLIEGFCREILDLFPKVFA